RVGRGPPPGRADRRGLRQPARAAGGGPGRGLQEVPSIGRAGRRARLPGCPTRAAAHRARAGRGPFTARAPGGGAEGPADRADRLLRLPGRRAGRALLEARGAGGRALAPDRRRLRREAAAVRDFLRNGRLLTLMLGHLTVDSYVGVLPVLYPLLIGRFHLSLATFGLVSLAYSGTAAISQPLFGILVDRYGTRMTGAALGWTALTFALVGFVPSFPLLLVLACASGLGSGAFHPSGALDVRALLPERRRSSGMSIYVTAGTVGVAIGPLIGILVFGLAGLPGTGFLVIPGILGGSYLLWRMRASSRTEPHRAPGAGGGRVPYLALAIVIGVMMSRSWTVNVFQAFTPTWYRELGYGPAFYGPLATTLVLASAVGTVGCG